MKFSALQLKHYALLAVAVAVAALSAYQAQSGSVLVVGGVGVIGVLTTLRALFSDVPGTVAVPLEVVK